MLKVGTQPTAANMALFLVKGFLTPIPKKALLLYYTIYLNCEAGALDFGPPPSTSF